MKVLVTGGTGFVGAGVSRALAGMGVPHRILSRRGGKAATGVEQVAGSVADPVTLGRALDGCDRILHLVGIISEGPGQTFESAHVDGTRNVLRAAREAGMRRFVHMSALGTRPGARSRYHRTKWEAEELVRTSGLAWTIFRPSVIYGPGDGFVNLFARIGRWSPLVPVIGSGRNLLQPVDLGNLSKALARSVVEEGPDGEVFELCGPEAIPLSGILEQIDEAMGRRRLRLKIPRPAAWLQARFLEWVFPAVFRKAPPLNRDQILMLDEDNVGDPEPACRRFGLELPGFRDGLEAMFRVR